jgi:hypothetical protein
MKANHLEAVVKKAQKVRLARTELREAILKAREAGESLSSIGEAARLSKQRIHQMIQEGDDA